jgi:hypothetical protein
MRRIALPPLILRLCRRPATLATASGVAFLIIDALLWLLLPWAPRAGAGPPAGSAYYADADADRACRGACLFAVIVRVMADAARLAQENRQIG